MKLDRIAEHVEYALRAPLNADLQYELIRDALGDAYRAGRRAGRKAVAQQAAAPAQPSADAAKDVILRAATRSDDGLICVPFAFRYDGHSQCCLDNGDPYACDPDCHRAGAWIAAGCPLVREAP